MLNIKLSVAADILDVKKNVLSSMMSKKNIASKKTEYARILRLLIGYIKYVEKQKVDAKKKLTALLNGDELDIDN